MTAAAVATYTLKYPLARTFKANGAEERVEHLTEVSIRRPIGADQRVLDSAPGTNAKSLLLIERCAGLDKATVDKLDVEDITAIGDIIDGFLPRTPKTGETSSDS